MDGASKFVKGDAIAGILILAINIIGGLIIGVAQHDMSFSSASESYILLSIGDGLVAQIPSLMLAIATAIIVTRVLNNRRYGSTYRQTSQPVTRLDSVSAVLLLIGFVPGMPNFMFLAAAAIAGLAGFLMRKREHGESELDAQQQSRHRSAA
jgi:flagellar biosynthesis protein FlhA